MGMDAVDYYDSCFVILIAMVCVFTHDFVVLKETKDVSIVLMSGASVYQVDLFAFTEYDYHV